MSESNSLYAGWGQFATLMNQGVPAANKTDHTAHFSFGWKSSQNEQNGKAFTCSHFGNTVTVCEPLKQLSLPLC